MEVTHCPLYSEVTGSFMYFFFKDLSALNKHFSRIATHFSFLPRVTQQDESCSTSFPNTKVRFTTVATALVLLLTTARTKNKYKIKKNI